jgi:hypothetical protein
MVCNFPPPELRSFRPALTPVDLKLARRSADPSRTPTRLLRTIDCTLDRGSSKTARTIRATRSWRPVIEHSLGRTVIAAARGDQISWYFGATARACDVTTISLYGQ